MKQTVRIIGGQFRGKKLHFPEVEGLRPTPDRVKETLFNWLMHDLRGARCLDAFAGSGSLGFEAFSRGAKQTVLVEASPLAYINLKKLAESFEKPGLEVVHSLGEDYIAKTNNSFDIIFLDPPFDNHLLPLCVDLLSTSTTLVNGGLLYIESANKQSLEPSLWRELKSKQAGQVSFCLYEKVNPKK